MNNLFLFTGLETFLIHEQINIWSDAFKDKYGGDMNLNTINGLESDIGEMIAQIGATPFLADKRLIFIEGLPEFAKVKKKNKKSKDKDKITKKDEIRDSQLKKLADYLDQIPDTSVVVFVQANPDKRKSLYKKIVQLGNVKSFETLNGLTLIKWVKNRIQKYGAKLDTTLAEYLISLTGQNLWRIDNELNKLSSFCADKLIDKNAIDKVVVPTIETNIFHLTDALGSRDQKKAIQNLHRSLSAGDSLRQVFYMIVRQFRLFIQVGGYLANYPNSNPGNIASSLKLHPFVAKNTMGQLRHFKINELKEAYEKLLDIDVGLKTSKIRITSENQEELAMAIERFIIEFSSKTKV